MHYIILLAFVVILCLLHYKRILLFIYRIFYSRYSYKYTNFFKKLINDNPYNYCIKDDFFDHILPFFREEKEAKKYIPVKEITFGSIHPGCSLNKILRLKEKPYCFNVYKFGDNHIKLIGYKDYILDSPCNILYYFVDNKYFMREFVFSLPKENSISQIATKLTEKYIDHIDTKSSKFYILDNSKNISIFFRNCGFQVTVAYLCMQEKTTNNKVKNIIEYFDSISKKIKNHGYNKNVNPF